MDSFDKHAIDVMRDSGRRSSGARCELVREVAGILNRRGEERYSATSDCELAEVMVGALEAHEVQRRRQLLGG